MYRALSLLLSPFIPLWLSFRQARGKEDALRMEERLGTAGLPRPAGPLLWVHAASVGESNSVLALIEQLLIQYTSMHVLLTTITVTSAELMKQRLPLRALHQFAPVDTPQAVEQFLSHWQPNAALWVESELWPNLITLTGARGCAMVLVNARMSERSFARWRRMPKMIAGLLAEFNGIFTQSEADAQRFRALGGRNVQYIGNLKYDTAPLPAPATEVEKLRPLFAGRKIWLMASIHPGEEIIAAEVHRLLKTHYPNLLTILVPRHPSRAEEMAHSLRNQNFRLAQRSKQETVSAETEMYLADTMGELGLFYTLTDTVCMGGSFVPHGGQNPLEPAAFGCAVLAGPHMENFAEICVEFKENRALRQVRDARELADTLHILLARSEEQKKLAQNAIAILKRNQGVRARVLATLEPLLTRALSADTALRKES